MKQLISLILALVLTALIGYAQVSDVDPKKVALIVAVGNYPANSGWQKINALNDAQLLEHTLKQKGFEIIVLKDQLATKRNIQQEFKKLTARPDLRGAIVSLHFAGHGQQIIDDNEDETMDNLDEAFIPYDALKTCEQGYQGENHLRDDEIGEMISGLKKSIGPKGYLLLTFDACHAGTMAKGDQVYRGTWEIFACGGKQKTPQLYTTDPVLFLQEQNTKNTPSNEGAPCVVLYATADNHLNLEIKDPTSTKNYGPLHYSFCNYVSRFDFDAKSSCIELFQFIQNDYIQKNLKQRPAMEGGENLELYGGRLSRELYFPVSQINEKGATLPVGLLQGIVEGSVIAFYTASVRKQGRAATTPVAIGQVKAAYITSSIVAIQQVNERLDPTQDYLGYVQQMGYGDLKVKIRFQVKQPGLENQFKKVWIDKTMLEYVPQAEDLLISQQGDLIKISSVNNPEPWSTVMQGSITDLANEIFDQVICPFIASQRLRKLRWANPGMELKMETMLVNDIQLTDNDKPIIGKRLPVDTKFDAKRGIVLTVDDFLSIKLSNTSNKRLYYSILEISPKDEVNPIIPGPKINLTKEECYVEPGQSTQEFIFRIWPPKGLTVNKLIVSSEPIDPSPIINCNIKGKNGVTDVSVSSFTYEIVDKK